MVAKVGGSLLDWPGLPDALSRLLTDRQARGERLVLIVGGGRAADWVRDLDRIHAIGDETAHALAIRSLDLTARVVAALVPGLEVVETLDAVETAWRAGVVPVLAPRRPLDDDDRDSPDALPHAWDVTSDSIAARMAIRLGAGSLILLKSTSVPIDTSREEAARLGVVDPIFPEASREVGDVAILDLRSGFRSPLLWRGVRD